jgi:hypothetical protein
MVQQLKEEIGYVPQKARTREEDLAIWNVVTLTLCGARLQAAEDGFDCANSPGLVIVVPRRACCNSIPGGCFQVFLFVFLFEARHSDDIRVESKSLQIKAE